MNLLSLVLYIVIQSLLANFASSSQCQSLSSAKFNDCIKAGYNVSSEFSSSRGPDEISSLIASMQRKLKNCSSISALMSCSLLLPKCPTASSGLPFQREVCRNFVRDCQNGSQENEGLIALLRGLCELIPSNRSNNSNTGADGK